MLNNNVYLQMIKPATKRRRMSKLATTAAAPPPLPGVTDFSSSSTWTTDDVATLQPMSVLARSVDDDASASVCLHSVKPLPSVPRRADNVAWSLSPVSTQPPPLPPSAELSAVCPPTQAPPPLPLLPATVANDSNNVSLKAGESDCSDYSTIADVASPIRGAMFHSVAPTGNFTEYSYFCIKD